jgi:SAM-dependent methyltransferase
MSESVRSHYEKYPYPYFSLLASVRTSDTYALNLTALWGRFNGTLPPKSFQRVLIAGCGSFSPYPFSLANGAAEITALDLSAGSLRRARLHCLLHGRFNVKYLSGDLLDQSVAAGPFGLIDAYGVLHHLDDPLAGFRALEARLAPGGILRIMIYNRYARREEESIRRAFRLMDIHDTAGVKALVRRSAPDSRLRDFFNTSLEAGYDAGLADALLHPRVHTYRIDELLEIIDRSGLELLQCTHFGACECVEDEIARIRQLETHRESCGNFQLYLGRKTTRGQSADGNSHIVLNPCLQGSVGPLQLGSLQIPPRFGFENPPLGWRERRFLNSFRHPVPTRSLNPEMRAAVNVYKRILFLIEYDSDFSL